MPRSIQSSKGVWLCWTLCSLVLGCGACSPPASAQEPAADRTPDFTNADCTDCHETDEGTDVPSSIVAVGGSVHAFADCIDCHPGAQFEEHLDGGLAADCAGCHDDAVAALASSAHGVARPVGSIQVGCASCHGPTHALRPQSDPESWIHASRVAETCGDCHADPDLAATEGIRLVQPLAAYTASVHAQAIAEGAEGARCSSCHGAHDILPAAEEASAVNRVRVVETCGSCHREIADVFASSVHGKAAAHGIQDSPVCTDCHGEHRILGPFDRDSPVYATNIPKLTCGPCHGDLRLSDKFGMPADKVPAYADSFHGLASRAGSVTVANCSSCHGVHDILPSSDPSAHTHRGKLASTCGNCHPGAGQRFAIGPVHVLPTESDHAAVYWVRRLYLGLIFLSIGAMVLHNVLDLYRKGQQRDAVRPLAKDRMTERMSSGFRLAHGLLASSFIVLAYTGFALKYPESWWAEPLLHWESRFGLRGWIHRLAGVALLAAVAGHAIHLMLDRRARRAIAALRPESADWDELKGRIGWFLGRRRGELSEPWVSYQEKAEYLFVLWGTAVMAVTGFLLWFEELTLRWLPTWVTDVATVVHFYEAVLATLAIVVWHFYSVLFDPAVYPMDPAWLTGRSVRRRRPPPRRPKKKKRRRKAVS